jgi:outer membrane protein assembly factor BamB
LLAPAIVADPATAGRPQISPADWPTLRGDLQRSGFYREFAQGQLRVAWRKELWRELTGPRTEVIVGAGLAFIGTYAGNFYAWDVQTGIEAWNYRTDGPIGHAAAFHEGTIFFGSMDQQLHALDASNGNVKWQFQAGSGIWVAPTLWRDTVLFGARDGTFHALDAATGDPRWSFQTGNRILTTASISEDGDRVVVASEDMHVYCLDVHDGTLLWKSRKMAGLSVRDYAPVLVRGLALITTSPVKEFHHTLDQHQRLLLDRTGFTGADDRYIPATTADIRAEQDFIVRFLKDHPEEQTFYAFDLKDGREPWIAPILYVGGLHNPPSPPCVNPDTGDVFVQVRSAYGVWDGGSEVRAYTSIGRLDLSSGRVELIEHGHRSKEFGRPAGQKDMPWMTFNLIGDETQTLACSPARLFSIHQGFIGSMDLTTGLTATVYGKRDTYGGFYGPGTFGWEQDGGLDRARAAQQPFGIVNEWHGPARALVSVAGNRVFFPVGSQVICLEPIP